jgi:hypothetical protein
MSLQINEVGQDTTFQFGALTRAFVSEPSKKLELYSALKEVEKYSETSIRRTQYSREQRITLKRW